MFATWNTNTTLAPNCCPILVTFEFEDDQTRMVREAVKQGNPTTKEYSWYVDGELISDIAKAVAWMPLPESFKG